MTTGLYLSATSPNSGKSLIALGLADSLIKRADRVGFFRPVFDGATIADDPMARLIREHFGLTEEQVGGAVSMNDARSHSSLRATPKRFPPAQCPPTRRSQLTATS